MGDTKEEAEWRAEFERFGGEQVRSTLDGGQFHEPKRSSRADGLATKLSPEGFEKRKLTSMCAGHFFGRGLAVLPGLSLD